MALTYNTTTIAFPLFPSARADARKSGKARRLLLSVIANKKIKTER